MKQLFFFLSTIILLSGFVALTAARSQPVSQRRIQLSQLPFSCAGDMCQTSEIKSAFVFDTFVIEWPRIAKTHVRFFEQGKWTEWFLVNGEHDVPDSENDSNPFQFFFFSNASAFQVSTTQQGIKKGSATYFTTPAYQKIQTDRVRMAANEAPADIVIHPRTEWLDPNLELVDEKRNELWPAEYEGIKKIVIHHTASTIRDMNDDGFIDSNDYRQAARAIYRYHAKVRGWGDIGYHYIIDPDGNIWEGRFGGDGSVGGHAYRNNACKKFGQSGIGLNRGSIGIALLGTYEDGDIAPQAKESLTSLIAQKAWEFELEPGGRSFFIDKEYPNIVAHRDIDCTTCPGTKLYAYLGTIVEQAQQKYQEYVLEQPRLYQGTIVDVTPTTVELKEGEEKQVIIRFRNSGTVAWRNYGDGATYIADAGIQQHLALLDTLRLATADEEERDKAISATSTITDFSRARLVTPNVRPGEIGTFSLTIKDPPKHVIEERRYVLALGKRGIVPLSEIAIEVINIGLPFAATIEKEGIEQNIDDSETQEFIVRYKNRGTQIWKKGDIALSLMVTDDASADLSNNTWKHKRGRVSFLEKEVLQGGIATFPIRITPRRIGSIVNTVFLEKEKEKIAGSDREQLRLSVKPAYVAELVSSSIPPIVQNTWRPRVAVTVKNVGTKKWDKVFLQSIGEQEKGSVFYHPSWENETHIEHAGAVETGSVVTFLYQMKPPKKEGVYKEKFALSQEKRTIYFLTQKGFEEGVRYAVRVDRAKKRAVK